MSETIRVSSSIPKRGAAGRRDAPRTARIAQRFSELAGKQELGLVAYLTAGDPTLEASEKIILAAVEAGADVIELGVPFSDPVADGPTIQRASERALRSGTTLAGVLELAAATASAPACRWCYSAISIPSCKWGLEKFAQAAAQAGIDGVLATDMTAEESDEYRRILSAQGLDTIFLGAPTSTDARLKQIAACCSGFVYLISRTGVTGTRDALPEELPALVRRVRRFTPLPVAVGFGISQPAHVSSLAGIADAAVVGSALVAEVEKASEAGSTADAAASSVAQLIRALKSAAGQSRLSSPGDLAES